jgi:sterol 14-demethylase
MTPIFGKGIVFDAPHAVKREQLKFIKHALRTDSFKGYVPLIAEEVESFFRDPKMWGPEAEGEVDLLVAMARLTINTATRCLLGEELKSKYGGEVADLLHDIDEGITPLAIINPYLPTPAFRRRDAARAKFVTMFSAIIAERRARQAKGAAVPEDMLQSFMDATYAMGPLKGQKLTDDHITGMLIGVLFAGQHTSSITTTWTALKVLERPELFDEVMAEQKAVLGDAAYLANSNAPLKVGPGNAPADAEMGINKVFRMDLLHLCMREALRMYPPLIMLMRKAMTDVKVKGRGGVEYTVPAGHYVFASPAVSMNLPTPDGAFEWPQRFDPFRFVEGRDEDTRKSYAYTAFGGGNHACIGEQFGFLQVKTIVSVLLRKYDIELLDPMPTPNYKAMVVGPTQPLRVRYRLRAAPYIPRTPFVAISAKCLSKAAKTVLGARAGAAAGAAAAGGGGAAAPAPAPAPARAPPAGGAGAAAAPRASAADAALPTYTAADVAKHNKVGDLWLIIDGYVYDVTKYAVLHPGGEGKILAASGKDASAGFHGPQHPSSVHDTVKGYKIGRLVA